MRLSLVSSVLVAVGLCLLRADLNACGDKSLSAGGIRMQRALAAQYPASILIVEAPNSRVSAAVRELKLQQTLQQVGHKYREVTSWQDAEAALATGKFNIVIADFSELGDVQQRVKASSSHAVVVPVAYKLTKTEAAQVAKQCQFLIQAPSRAAQYLGTIAEAVRVRGNSTR